MSTKKLSKKIDNLSQKLATLEREMELFIPTESTDEYENADEIEGNYQAAASQYPPHDPERN